MSGTLYLVPTPIGNLGDISPRMAQTMAQADFIAAEDTRVTMKLLNHLELKKPFHIYICGTIRKNIIIFFFIKFFNTFFKYLNLP